MGVHRAGPAVATALAAALMLAGCATGAPMADATGSTRPPFLTTTPSASAATPIAVSPARWDAIVADLAGRGVSETPTVVSAQAVQWPNGSLGCPSPGTSYIQQVIDGAQVVVSAAGRTWDYRFDRGDTPRLCES